MEFTRSRSTTPPRHERLLHELSIQSPKSPGSILGVELKAHKASDSDTGSLFEPYLRRFLDRLGYFDTLVLPLGFPLIFGVLGTLLSLWWWGNSSVDERYGGFWSQRANAGQLNPVVTACSAIIRLALGAQAFSCCCMVASLVLEKENIRKADAHKMSVYQWINSGPNSLLYPLLGVWFDNRKGRWRPSQGLLLVGLLAFLNISVQFSSTILVSDLALTPLAQSGAIISVRLPMMLTDMNLNSTVAPVYDSTTDEMELIPLTGDTSFRPFELPVFAERVINIPSLESGEQPYGTSGLIQRAFLPLSARQLATLYSYKGPGAIMEAQYVCFPPKVDKLTLQLGSYQFENHGYYSLQIEGHFGIPSYIQKLTQDTFGHQNITIPSMNDLQVTNCTLSRNDLPNICAIPNLKPQMANSTKITAEILIAFAPNKLTGTGDGPVIHSLQDQGLWHPERISQHQEWTVIEASKKRSTPLMQPILNLNASMCIYYRKATNRRVKISNFPNRETTERQSINFLEAPWSDAPQYLTLAQDVLGVADATWIPPEKRINVLSFELIEPVGYGPLAKGGMYLFGERWKKSEDLNHISLDLYTATLAKLNRPSLSLAALDYFHFAFSQQESLLRSIRVASWGIGVQYAPMEPREIPRRWIGIAIVIGIVSLHSLIVVYIIVLYVRSKSFARTWRVEEYFEKMESREALNVG